MGHPANRQQMWFKFMFGKDCEGVVSDGRFDLCPR